MPDVMPVTDWRVQPTFATVTGTTSDANNLAALMGANAANVLPTFSVAANGTGEFILDLPEIVAPGAVLYLTTTSGAATARTLTMDKSTDGGGTYAPISFVPMQTQSADNIDQLIDIPASAAAKYRLRYATTATHFFGFQINQLQTDPLRNDIHAVVGMSITISNTQAGQLRTDAQARYPTRDPIFVAMARSGALTANMLTEQLVKLVQPRPYIARVIMDHGPNYFLGGTQTWVARTQGQRDAIIADVAAVDAWAAANSRQMIYVGPTFVSNLNYDAGGATGILQEHVVDGPSVSIANQANGMRPFNMGAFNPSNKLSGRGWNTVLDAPAFDGYGPSLLSWDFWKQLTGGMTPQDGVHPATLGGELYRIALLDAYNAIHTGVKPDHYAQRKIAAAEPFVSAAQKNRLYLGVASLPDTVDAGAVAARAALKARIDAIGAADVEKAGQTSPSTMTGIVAAFDFDDMDTLFSDDAGTIPAKDFEIVHKAKDKSANAYHMVNATGGTALPAKQPQFVLGEAQGQRGLRFSGVTYLEAADAALYGALNTASAPFIIAWIDTPFQASTSASLKILWQFLGTGGLQARFASGTSRVQLVGASVIGTEPTDAALNVPHAYVLYYNGTTLTLYRDGIATVNVSYSKPSWTATGLRMAATGNGFIGRRKTWNLITGSVVTTVQRDALIARLAAQAA
ncbi:hypothetical protein [Aureimonas sp. SA4125]|uniref:hypothetical protein n=1 Tax=Aureimonas sp. SA4125 TaxID=2826993 RepID=UPI001CC5849F|nr:hypothetical protein [Aureimonas sp. SA4125]